MEGEHNTEVVLSRPLLVGCGDFPFPPVGGVSSFGWWCPSPPPPLQVLVLLFSLLLLVVVLSILEKKTLVKLPE